MDVNETDPPFRFRNVRGPVRIGDDTVRFDITHFDLPGSTGRARGMVHWKQKGPVRYDVQVAGDSVSLADIAWVYPTLPRQGGGRMLLHIVNDERDPRVLDYRITRMDVRAAKSHLVGDWTFGVGGPVLVVKDVDLRAEPVDFDLFRTLAGGPFPVDWQGTLTGNVRGRGGRLGSVRGRDARLQVGPRLCDAIEPDAREPLHDQAKAAVGQPEVQRHRGGLVFACQGERAVLATVRFRPGTTPEGKAIRATAKIEFTVF